MTNLVTNIVAGASAVHSMTSVIDWTKVITVISMSLAAMGTLISIFSNKFISEESLRNSNYIKEISDLGKENAKKQSELRDYVDTEMGELNTSLSKRISDLRDYVSELRIEIEKLKSESTNNNRSLEELKRDYRELVQRLDSLLKQLLEWVN